MGIDIDVLLLIEDLADQAFEVIGDLELSDLFEQLLILRLSVQMADGDFGGRWLLGVLLCPR